MAHVDLNLLVALDALLEENSVQAAADRLHLSAPAMSRTLTRIRRTTGDDILVRTGRTMTPTPRALELREETHALVQRARAVLAPAPQLDLPALDRVFSIRAHDALTAALAPLLIGSVASAAPQAALRLLSETTTDNLDLSRGHVDLEIGSTSPTAPEIAVEPIGTDQLVAAFRAEHPLAATPTLTAHDLAQAPHVTVSRRGRLTDVLDELLAAEGLRRRVIAALPTSTAALQLVAGLDAVTVVAERLCRPTWTLLRLQTRPLPFQLPPVPVTLAWHHRYDNDPAHTWLRDQVRTALHTLLHTSEEGDPHDVEAG